MSLLNTMQTFIDGVKNITSDIIHNTLLNPKPSYVAHNTIIGTHLTQREGRSYQKALKLAKKKPITQQEQPVLIWSCNGSFIHEDDANTIVIVTSKRILILERTVTQISIKNIASIHHEPTSIFQYDSIICVLKNYTTKIIKIYHRDACTYITSHINNILSTMPPLIPYIPTDPTIQLQQQITNTESEKEILNQRIQLLQQQIQRIKEQNPIPFHQTQTTTITKPNKKTLHQELLHSHQIKTTKSHKKTLHQELLHSHQIKTTKSHKKTLHQELKTHHANIKKHKFHQELNHRYNVLFAKCLLHDELLTKLHVKSQKRLLNHEFLQKHQIKSQKRLVHQQLLNNTINKYRIHKLHQQTITQLNLQTNKHLLHKELIFHCITKHQNHLRKQICNELASIFLHHQIANTTLSPPPINEKHTTSANNNTFDECESHSTINNDTFDDHIDDDTIDDFEIILQQ